MANNFGGGSFTLLDYDRESSTMHFNTAAITAVSLPGTLTAFGNLRTAIGNISVGTVASEALYVNRSKLSNVPPADPNAQRERKWLVSYEDTTEFFDPGVDSIPNAGFGSVFSVEVPCADFSGTHLLTNSADADLTDPDIAAFKTAFEAIARSPYGGAVNVIRMQAIGKST